MIMMACVYRHPAIEPIPREGFRTAGARKRPAELSRACQTNSRRELRHLPCLGRTMEAPRVRCGSLDNIDHPIRSQRSEPNRCDLTDSYSPPPRPRINPSGAPLRVRMQRARPGQVRRSCVLE